MRRWITRLVLAAAAVLLVALTLEALVRLQAAHRLHVLAYRQFHPFLQVLPRPNLEGINADRFRGEPIDVDRPPGALRVFALGGSTTLGVENRYADTYPALLHEMLRARFPNRIVEVQNAGGAWWTTAHTLINYQLRVREFAPDVVIVFHGINDLYRSFSPPWFAVGEYRSDYSHYLGPQIGILGPQVGFLDEVTRPRFADLMIWRLARRAVLREPFPYSRNRSNVQRLMDLMHPVEVTEFRSLDSFRENYALLIRSAMLDGTRVIVGSAPYLYKPDLSDDERRMLFFAPMFCAEKGRYPTVASMQRGMEQFNAVARDVAAAAGVPFLDFAREVPRTSRYFSDDVHMKRPGNEIVARMVYRWIVEHVENGEGDDDGPP